MTRLAEVQERCGDAAAAETAFREALDLDADGDARLTWGEVRRRHDDIARLALAALELRADDTPCTVRAVRRRSTSTPMAPTP